MINPVSLALLKQYDTQLNSPRFRRIRTFSRTKRCRCIFFQRIRQVSLWIFFQSMPSFSQTSMLSLQSVIDESILNNSQSNITFTSRFFMTIGGYSFSLILIEFYSCQDQPKILMVKERRYSPERSKKGYLSLHCSIKASILRF